MSEDEAKTKQVARRRRRWRRAVAWIVLTPLLLVVAAVGSLYIPGVLNLLAGKILPGIEESSGLRITADDIRLRFPLRLSLENALVEDMKAGGDTMVSVRTAELAVNPLTLLRGELTVSNAVVRDAFYQMGAPDSLYIGARIDSVGAAASMNLQFSSIDIGHADLDGARVNLLMGPDTTETPKDTTATAPLTIRASGPITLRNVDYRMSMALTDDTIAARVSDAKLTEGHIDIADIIDIRTGTLTMAVDSALYGTRGATPVAGLDLQWLTLRDASARVDSFSMHGTQLRVPLKSLKAASAGGLSLEGHGIFEMDSALMSAKGFDIIVDGRTRLALDAEMGLDSLNRTLRADARADVFPSTVGKALPAYAPLLAPLPADVPLRLRVVAGGTMDSLKIDSVGAAMKGIFALNGSGTARNLSDPEKLDADVSLDGKLVNAQPIARLMPAGVKLPPLRLRGTAQARGENYAARLTATTGAGRLALDGKLAATAERYDVKLRADSFPVSAFMPDLGVGAVTASVSARGRLFNPLRPGASAEAKIDLAHAGFRGHHIGGIALDAALADSKLTARLNSTAPLADLTLDLSADLARQSADWNLQGDIRRLDLHGLGLSDSTMNATMKIETTGFAAFSLDTLNATATLRDADLAYGSLALRLDSLNATADAGRAATVMTLGNRTINLDFSAPEPLDALTEGLGRAATMASTMMTTHNIDVDSLVRSMPRFMLDFDARPGNPIAGLLEPSGIGFNRLTLKARRDSSLHASARALRITSGQSMRIDTVNARLLTRNDTLLIAVDADNAPGTLDEFATVRLRGYFAGRNGRFFLRQRNISGDTGYRIGFNATLTDSLIALNLTPVDPTIAYKKWTINADNYLTFNPKTMRIEANLDARGDDSRIQLLTSQRRNETADSVAATNELTLLISDIHLQDWLKINPFAPPIAGNVSADMTVNYTDKSVNGNGIVSLSDLTYGKKPVGNFLLDLDVATDFGGAIRADASLDVNGVKTMTLTGALNDTTRRSPLDLKLRVMKFPLDVANPFMPGNYANLSGSLSGLMDVSGTFSDMRLDGSLNFNDAKIRVGMMGSDFTLDSVAIPVDSNLVRFDNFAIYGSNSNPLRVNGSVDMRRFNDPRIDLNLAAKNMQIIKSKQARGVELYGRGFINLNADVKGSLNVMRVNADMAILPQTNLTYQITDARAAVGLQPDDDVVKFVNFADTAQVQQADTVARSGMLMFVDANLDIRQGAQFTVDLSADGQNRAQIKANGILDYTMNPTQPDGRLTGRLTIDGGFFRYSLPVISEKLFTFNPGSYVAFNGPIMNPTLNVSAVDRIRANVTRQGENSRLIDFDVTLSATGTPSRLDVAFDLTTDDDISVQNELQSMSQTQRANQAMNLLLYGVYTGQGTTGNANLSGNALYGFLTSQINTWAANTIKGVDVSFGLDQYDRTRNGSTQTATQYSYKVSKTLFNDRFKIVVGGNYSTDVDAEENVAQNLISDISFEYMLNDSGSMFVRLFRHTGYESILEGEVTQTGVGFVIKRRIRRVADIFNFIKAAKQ